MINKTPTGNKTENKILLSLIIIESASFIISSIHYYYGVIPGFILPILNIAAVILFIIFGIRILKLKDGLFVNLKNLKIFITSMFFAFGLVTCLVPTCSRDVYTIAI